VSSRGAAGRCDRRSSLFLHSFLPSCPPTSEYANADNDASSYRSREDVWRVRSVRTAFGSPNSMNHDRRPPSRRYVAGRPPSSRPLTKIQNRNVKSTPGSMPVNINFSLIGIPFPGRARKILIAPSWDESVRTICLGLSSIQPKSGHTILGVP
jgi:hypothetical protein